MTRNLKKSKRRSTRKLRCERLEDRRVLTTFVVDSLADIVEDDGELTLREAILAAELDESVGDAPAGDGADLIQFDPGLPIDSGTGKPMITIEQAGDNVAGPSAFLISTEITIEGPIVISAEDSSISTRFFRIDADGNLTLQGVDLEYGLSQGGDGASGLNQSGGGGGGAGLGGAILNEGSLTVVGGLFSNNEALGGDGGRFGIVGVANVGGGGGGVGSDGLEGDESLGGQGGGINGGLGADAAGRPNGESGGIFGGGGGGLGLTSFGGSGGFGGGGGGASREIGDQTQSGSAGAGGFAGGGGGDGDIDDIAIGGFGGGDGIFGGGGGGGLGGAIFNMGTIDIVDATFANNSAQGGDGADADGGSGLGGAIFNLDGVLTIESSLLNNNDVAAGTDFNNDPDSIVGGDGQAAGGGIYIRGDSSDVTIVNSTLSGNSAIDGAAIFNDAGGLTLQSSTIANNALQVNADGSPQGAIEGRGSSNVINTLVVSNTADVNGNFTSGGGNMLGDVGAANGFDDPSDIVGDGSFSSAEIGLQSLADNGGPTLTHALALTSLAVDAGVSTDPELVVDQRGSQRIVDADSNGGARIDIGSFELIANGGIHAFKFNDLNTNGVFDAEEGPFEDGGDFSFELTGDTDGDGTTDTLVVTPDSSGQFRFLNLFPGEYQLREMTELLPSDILPTTTVSRTIQVGSSQQLVWQAGVNDGFNEVVVGDQLIFGNAEAWRIFVRVFDDVNADGQDGFLERGLSGSTVFVDLNDDGILNNTVEDGICDATATEPCEETASFGGATITGFGTYTAHVRQVARPGWLETSAPQDPIDFVPGEFSNTVPRFGNNLTLATGLIAGAVDVGDVDGNGTVDVVVANDYESPQDYSSSLTILQNDGDMNFGTSQTVPLPNHTRPQDVVVADLNDDGRADIVVASLGDPTQAGSDTNGILVLMNDGGGVGSANTVLDCSTEAGSNGGCDGPMELVLGDLNQDEIPDIVAANMRSHNVSILLGDGSGGFTSAGFVEAGAQAMSVEIGELTGDEFTDLVVANYADGTVQIFAGDGQGGFSEFQTITDLDGPVDLLAADLNDDMQLELVVAEYLGDQVSVFSQSENGTVELTDTFGVGEGAGPRALAIDTNLSESFPDVVVANADAGTLTRLERGSGESSFFNDVMPLPQIRGLNNPGPGISPRDFLIADLNGDADVDYVIGHLFGGASINNGMQPVTDALVLDPTVAPGAMPMDANDDGIVSPVDALVVINFLNGVSQAEGEDALNLDFNNDQVISPADVLVVINYLNQGNVALPELTTEQLEPFRAAGLGQLEGVLPDVLFARISQIEWRIEDLPGELLSMTTEGVIVMDVDAAGRGWFLDATPLQNEEFTYDSEQSWLANERTTAASRVDLLTVVLHEMAHRLGLDHSDDDHELLSETLPIGERRVSSEIVDSVLAEVWG